MSWILNVGNLAFTDIPGDYYGFIYKITNLDNGRIYIGRKNFYSKRKRKFGKKEIAKMTDKRLKQWEYVEKESNWKEYTSSSKELNEDIKNGATIEREIIKLVKDKVQMTYFETKYQFMNEVLEIESYNDNILGKFYRKIFEE